MRENFFVPLEIETFVHDELLPKFMLNIPVQFFFILCNEPTNAQLIDELLYC